MFKRTKYFVAGFLAASILMFSVTSFAEDIYSTIEVLKDYIKVVVNGESKTVGNFYYDGSTYVKLSDISDAFGKKIEWDEAVKTVYIDEKDSIELKKSSPSNDQQDYYPNYNYLWLGFSCDVKGVNDFSKVGLVSSSGEIVPITEIKPGKTSKDSLVFELGSKLKFDTEYLFTIARNAVETSDGKKYDRDIIIKFKTSKTVLKAKLSTIITSRKIESMTITGNGKIYTPYFYDGYQFIIKDLDSGKYTIKVIGTDGKVYEKEVLVREGMMNYYELTVW